MKKKALAVLLSLLMLTGVTLPGTWANEDGIAPTEINETEPAPESETEETETEKTDTDESETETETEESETETEPETEPEPDEPETEPETEEPEDEPIEELPEGELPEELEPFEPLYWVRNFTDAAPLMMMNAMMLADVGDTSSGDSGVVLEKKAVADGDNFKITLEAYATGTSHTERHVAPVDVVLVLDISNSMRYPMGDSGYVPVYGTDVADQDGTGKSSFSSYTKDGVTSDLENNVKIKNAYHVDGHDASNYDSNFRTYYVIENEKYVPVFYYPLNELSSGNSSFGWTTGSRGLSSTPIVPKTSADDTNTDHVQFYKINPDTTRFATLKTAANSFVTDVLSQQVDGGTNSIAVVSYASGATVVSNFSNDANTLTNAINNMKMDQNNGTRTDSALDKACTLLNGLDDTHNGHNKVVVLFTDGEPAVQEGSGLVKFGTTADNAISKANNIKSGATLYTIGVFNGASGNISSYNNSITNNSDNNSTKTNTFLHLVSSNFPDATSLSSHGDMNSNLDGKSYYLSAGDATALQGAFNQIFAAITNTIYEAANKNLGTETVIKDIIAPSFTVPANTSDIKVYTADCTGAGLTFATRTEVTSGITTTITGDTLDVKGFDFSANWCGDHSGTYGGKKLIIEFTVSPKTGFLGGNDVPTNGENSGMYSNGSCIGNFEVPTVNVPIKDITITASDKNVYLTQVPDENQIKADVTIKCGDVDITEPSKLEEWQTKYVNINTSITTNKIDDKDFDATADGSYTVTATVSPTNTGDSTKPGTVATEKSGTEKKNINVLKPELTYKDSTVYYGDTAPTDFSENKTGEVWKHGETLSTAVTMIGTAPTLTTVCTPDDTKIANGKINSKQDIPVGVTVKIGDNDVTDYTTFQHTDCIGKTCGKPDNGKFWLHVKTFSLTIVKTGWDEVDAGQSFIFNITDPDNVSSRVVIHGNGIVKIEGLKKGVYTVEEDESWSWRYECDSMVTNKVVVGGISTGRDREENTTLTFHNKRTEENWLDGNAYCENIFDDTNHVVQYPIETTVSSRKRED